MATSPHVGDVGTVIRFRFKDENGNAVNIAAATELTATLRRPDGAREEDAWDLTVEDGAAGTATYTTIAGDLDQAGPWETQGRVVTPAGEWRSDIVAFEVEGNL